MPRLHLPRLRIPGFKIFRLILPTAVFIAGTMIFLCGLVRTYHVNDRLTQNIHERRILTSRNERMEWWAGLLVMGNAVFAIVAVVIDKPFPFKISVFTCGCCLILLLYAMILDGGEFSKISREKNLKRFLETDGYTCQTTIRNITITGWSYVFHDCECSNAHDAYGLEFFVPYSCEILDALYYVHAVLTFGLCCAISFDLFLIFSFVLVLKRISQITTALHLDEKPLSEDFQNISGNLYVDA